MVIRHRALADNQKPDAELIAAALNRIEQFKIA
jgi:hypothetical protein